jgi:hypothetical protein
MPGSCFCSGLWSCKEPRFSSCHQLRCTARDDAAGQVVLGRQGKWIAQVRRAAAMATLGPPVGGKVSQKRNRAEAVEGGPDGLG